MSKYIRIEDAIETAISGCASWDGGYFPSMDDPIKEEFDAVADKCIDLVRCGECIHRYVDGENVRFNVCELNHNKVQAGDWFCADGERRTDEQQS